MDIEANEGKTLLAKAKRYSNTKYVLSLIETAYLLIALFLFLGLGFSSALAENITRLVAKDFLTAYLYILIAYFLYCFLNFPLSLYRTFILEHKFCLSNQKIVDWFLDQLKEGVIFYLISLIFFKVFYYIVKYNPRTWWFLISLCWIFFGFVLARLSPIIIIPLFFKYKKLSDETLRQRIIALAGKMKVKLLDVFEIDFSSKTLKANAAFVGWGASRRVILADTLKDKYSYDEIEVILAHEFAHYKLKHLFKLILINSSATVAAFYLIFRTSGHALGWFGLSSLSDIAALPVILLYFVIFGIIMQPLANYISRCLERNADRMALSVTGLKDAFVSTMEKLASQNLSDRSPHPLIKFFFFDHPPVDERIALATNI